MGAAQGKPKAAKGERPRAPRTDAGPARFNRRILGAYDRGLDATKGFYWRILTSGDATSGLAPASKDGEGR